MARSPQVCVRTSRSAGAHLMILSVWSATLTLGLFQIARHTTRIRPRPGCRGCERNRLLTTIDLWPCPPMFNRRGSELSFRMVMIPVEAYQTHRRRKEGKGNAAKQFAFDLTDITFGTSDSPGKG